MEDLGGRFRRDFMSACRRLAFVVHRRDRFPAGAIQRSRHVNMASSLRESMRDATSERLPIRYIQCEGVITRHKPNVTRSGLPEMPQPHDIPAPLAGKFIATLVAGRWHFRFHLE